MHTDCYPVGTVLSLELHTADLGGAVYTFWTGDVDLRLYITTVQDG